MTSLQNLFAFLKSPEEGAIVRIPLAQEVQQELTQLFAEQAGSFLADDLEPIEFDGRLEPDEGQILVIDHFNLPVYFAEAAQNPAACQVLNFNDRVGQSIRSIFSVLQTNTGPQMSFQVFDRRRLLAGQSRFSIISQAGTFKRLEDPGLMLDYRLAAHFSEGTLYFRSYGAVRRMFGLTAYYHEATEPEIDAFLDTERLFCPDHDRFRDTVDTWIRKKIALVRDGGVLDTIAPRRIKSAAEHFGLRIDLKKVNGKEAIVLPPKKKDLKELLRFLDQDHYKAPLTGTHFVSNSKMKA